METSNSLQIPEVNYEQLPDWKLIDEISIPLLEEGIGTFEVLQRALPSVVFARINSVSDKGCNEQRLMKLFKIAQMHIEYLLTTQHDMVEKLRSERRRSDKFHKENHTFRKTFDDGGQRSGGASRELFRCNECSKIFLHSTFLCDHIQRKHGGVLAAGATSMMDDSNETQTLALNFAQKRGLNVPRSSSSDRSGMSSHSGDTSVWT
ncbi:zinc finger protein Dzip1 [Ditylenchus destructor]|nr:zinc finger protein Dzip1 [Ditylenchus destructor]